MVHLPIHEMYCLSSHIFLAIVALISLQVVLAAAAENINHDQVNSNCTATSVASFNLLARYNNDTSKTVPLKLIDVKTIPKIGWAILSGCPNCNTPWQYNVMKNEGIIPKSKDNLNTVSYSLVAGNSPTFISMQYTPDALAAYCFIGTTTPILAGYGNSSAWSLCPNVTAGGRLDVVWSAVDHHPNYRLGQCAGVSLEQTPYSLSV